MAFLLINYPQTQDEYQYFEHGFSGEELQCEPIHPNLFFFTQEKNQIKVKPNFMKTLQDTSERLQSNLNIPLDSDFTIVNDPSAALNAQDSQLHQVASMLDAIKTQRSQSVKRLIAPHGPAASTRFYQRHTPLVP